jgi:predicted ABC-type transport system involved in lysophospholipase L1 biosynthesis ATPase subunit
LADEPTGNLDPKTADQVLELLLEMNRVHGTALVVVTHSPEIATRLGRRVVLVDGYLEELAEGAPVALATGLSRAPAEGS